MEQFSKVVPPMWSPLIVYKSHQCPHDSWCLVLSPCKILTSLVAILWYVFVVLICISLITREVKHHFKCLLPIWILPFIKCLFKSLPHFSFSFLTDFYLFIFERGSVSGGGAERGGQRVQSGFRVDSTEPDVGLEPVNREIMTWAEGRRLTNWAPHVPPFSFGRSFSEDL